MTDNDIRAYAPRHAAKEEEKALPVSEAKTETETENEDVKKYEEETAETEVPAVLPEEKKPAGARIGRILIAVSVMLAAAILLLALLAKLDSLDPHSLDTDETEQTELERMDPVLRDMWLSNRAQSPDYIGQIVFDSGLIDLPVVQARSTIDLYGDPYVFFAEEGMRIEDPEGYTGNDVYIWTGWITHQYDPYGEETAPFLHYQNTLADQNLIIFGHHFARDWDQSGSRQFTPLDLLMKEENYEENSSLKLILDNEIREYEVAFVFTISISDDYDAQIMRTDMNRDLSGNYDPDFFESYIGYMKERSFYDPGVGLDRDDRILSLVTCIEHQPDLRQIVVCRETGRIQYSG